MNNLPKQCKVPRKLVATVYGFLIFLAFLSWLPASAQAASTQSMIMILVASPTVVQSTPTVDPTVTALDKQKLEDDTNWWWNNAVTLITSLTTTLALLAGGIFALVRWFGDRKDERESRNIEQIRWLEDRQTDRDKRDEDRFYAAIVGLGSDIQATKVGAAIMLRTFLRPGYQRFYRQVFDLAVSHLRLREIDLDQPPDSLNQALITIYKESFSLVRDSLGYNSPFLDASRIHLDQAYLVNADLKKAWMPNSDLRKANLKGANLSHADLSDADLSDADLSNANLTHANLHHTHLTGANLMGANLTDANIVAAVVTGANLSDANLTNANTIETTLTGALSLTNANIKNTQGLTPDLLEKYKTRGAIS